MANARIYMVENEVDPSDGATKPVKKYLAEVDENTPGQEAVIADMIKRFSRIYRTVKVE